MKPGINSMAIQTSRVSLTRFVGYFLWLGTVGFGGPIALAGHMQQDLVDERGWISREDYLEGLALAQLAPGPLAAQLAIYLGYTRAGIVGATAVGIAFVLPSFLMVLALSAAYVRFGGLPWMQGIFYGIGAAVIGIIARSAFKLTKLTLGKDKLLWGIFLVLAISTAWTSKEIVWLFLLGGLVAVVVKAYPHPNTDQKRCSVVVYHWNIGCEQHPLASLSLFCQGWVVRIRERTRGCTVSIRWSGAGTSLADGSPICRRSRSRHDYPWPRRHYCCIHRLSGGWHRRCNGGGIGDFSARISHGRCPCTVVQTLG
jgi:chromate transport protein ChrA